MEELLVYVAHPYGGTEENKQAASDWMDYLKDRRQVEGI